MNATERKVSVALIAVASARIRARKMTGDSANAEPTQSEAEAIRLAEKLAITDSDREEIRRKLQSQLRQNPLGAYLWVNFPIGSASEIAKEV